MKKIMICMLLLLPLIIVFSVLLAIDVISIQAYIAVEDVDIIFDENPVGGTVLEIDLETLEIQFKGATYPLNAKNSGFIWEIVDEQADGGETLSVASVDQYGKVSLHNFGRCRLKITSNSEAKTTYVDLIVTGSVLKSATIALTKVSHDELSFDTSNQIVLGERRFLAPILSPSTAKVNDCVYISSDENILTVDENGIVTANAEGSAEITLTANGNITAKLKINVILGRLDRTIFYCTEAFDLTAAGFSGFHGGNIINGSAVVNTDQGVITLEPCAATDIYIPDMLYSAYTLKVGGLPLILKAKYKAFSKKDETVDVLWSSSDVSRAEISADGKISAKESGQVVFTAIAGENSADIAISVVEPVRTIVLDTQQIKVGGIEEVRIFGNETINENKERISFTLPVSVAYPEKLSLDNYEFSTDSDVAYFESGSNILKLKELSEKTDITVTVKAKNPFYDVIPVFASFKLSLDKGVNVYSENNIFKVITDELDNEEKSSLYLQSDIELSQTLELSHDIYGNGFSIDAQKWNKRFDTKMLHIIESGVILQNVRIVCDVAEKINKPNGLSGYAVVVGDLYLDRITDVEINYCIIENAYYLIDLNKCEVKAEGSVFRNCSNFGIRMVSSYIDGARDPYNYSDLKLNNVVMSNIVAPAIGLATESFEKNDRKQGALTKQSSVLSTGFLDIYNWQDVTEAKMLDREIIKDNAQLNSAVQTLIKNSLKVQLSKSMYEHIRVIGEDGTLYFHLGIIAAGGICPTTAEVSIEDPNYYNKFDLFDIDDVVLKNALADLDKCYLWLYTKDAAIQPNDEVEFNKQLYDELKYGR